MKTENCTTKISFITKLDVTCDKNLAQLLTFMHILKENKIIFINKKQDYTEINTKFSTPHFTSNQILILYKSYQWVELYLLLGIWASGKFGETEPEYPKSSRGTHLN